MGIYVLYYNVHKYLLSLIIGSTYVFLDSERTEGAIDFTMMSYFFLYLATI